MSNVLNYQKNCCNSRIGATLNPHVLDYSSMPIWDLTSLECGYMSIWLRLVMWWVHYLIRNFSCCIYSIILVPLIIYQKILNLYLKGERATGYGVALLNVLFSNHIKASMLQVSDISTEQNGPESHANGVKKQRLS